jgi:hypothetical protein
MRKNEQEISNYLLSQGFSVREAGNYLKSARQEEHING